MKKIFENWNKYLSAQDDIGGDEQFERPDPPKPKWVHPSAHLSDDYRKFEREFHGRLGHLPNEQAQDVIALLSGLANDEMEKSELVATLNELFPGRSFRRIRNLIGKFNNRSHEEKNVFINNAWIQMKAGHGNRAIAELSMNGLAT